MIVKLYYYSVVKFGGVMKTKISLLIEQIENNNWKKALSIAAKFRDLGDFKSEIVRAHECLTNPRFYQSIGFDIDATVEIGKSALIARYLKQ